MIYESKDLSSMYLDTLLGELHEHEIKFKRLAKNKKKGGKNKKIMALSGEEAKDSKNDEDMNLLVRKFKNFLRNEKKPQSVQLKNEKIIHSYQYASCAKIKVT